VGGPQVKWFLIEEGRHTLGALLEPWLTLKLLSHRREILFDYEQYEYHGTSVSHFLKVNCRPSKLSGSLHIGELSIVHV